MQESPAVSLAVSLRVCRALGNWLDACTHDTSNAVEGYVLSGTICSRLCQQPF